MFNYDITLSDKNSVMKSDDKLEKINKNLHIRAKSESIRIDATNYKRAHDDSQNRHTKFEAHMLHIHGAHSF